jgi:Fic family protein
LLVVLLLIEWGLLQGPHLTISEFLEDRREGYIDGLRGVSIDGDWDGWVRYFLDAVREQARRDRWRVEQLIALRERWRDSYQSARSVTLLQMLDFMVERPIFSARQVIEQLGFTHRAVQRAIDQLIVNGVLREITGQRRNRVYAADEVLAIVSPVQGRG